MHSGPPVPLERDRGAVLRPWPSQALSSGVPSRLRRFGNRLAPSPCLRVVTFTRTRAANTVLQRNTGGRGAAGRWYAGGWGTRGSRVNGPPHARPWGDEQLTQSAPLPD